MNRQESDISFSAADVWQREVGSIGEVGAASHTGQAGERAIAVGLAADIQPQELRSDANSLAELGQLLATAGGFCVETVLQHRHSPDPRSFIGRGKAEELKARLMELGCTLAVFDNELTPSQSRALEAELGVRVLDRSGLILDIFAQRARTREGRLQVQLAQYKYLLPRLTGLWTHLDRETSAGAGPIGARGTGETQLESDRRVIRKKIDRLEAELAEVRKNRATQRARRLQQGLPLACLVGYTNAGKSTLLNALTGAGVAAEDRLFDTLDTVTRRLSLPGGQRLLLSDTVGFIRRLPHHLVAAFKATLEELTYADLILQVVDVSSPTWPQQMQVTEALIDELARPETPRLTVYNKLDAASPDALPPGRDVLGVSAVRGTGLEELKQRMAQALAQSWRTARLLLPFDRGSLLERLHREGRVRELAYTEGGAEVVAELPRSLWPLCAPYVLEGDLSWAEDEC